MPVQPAALTAAIMPTPATMFQFTHRGLAELHT